MNLYNLLIRRSVRHVLCFVFIGALFSSHVYSQRVAIKSNILYDLTSTLNVGGEIKSNDRYSANLSINYNPWTFGDNKKMKHFLVQPEYRRWFDETFIGTYVGIQAHCGMFNWGGIGVEDRYQGNLLGMGLTVGYQWMLSPLWNLEVGGALGYAYLNYDRYGPEKGAAWKEKGHTHYWGLTQIGISFVYFIQ